MVNTSGVLYVIVCGAPRARRVGELVTEAQDEGWDVCVIATPAALKFIDRTLLEQQTGHPIRSAFKDPDEPDVLPPADAIIVCPATFNTVNKSAAGIADTLALGLITEAVGAHLPLVLAPALTSTQATHPAFDGSVALLREEGVVVLYGSGVYEPIQPGETEKDYPFRITLEALRRRIAGSD